MRLDDACPTMNREAWERTERILDQYDIRPIVGIIPDSKDETFNWVPDSDFWTKTVCRYVAKKWTIAQHGCHHRFLPDVKSEFSNLSYDHQAAIIRRGHQILNDHGVTPTCFFAPAHAFDDVTVDVCRDVGSFRYISDGKALFPYRYRGMLFLPSLFDSPTTLFPCGIFTFVLHPNTMTDKHFDRLESFCRKHRRTFASADDVATTFQDTRRKRNFLDRLFAMGINLKRSLRREDTALRQ